MAGFNTSINMNLPIPIAGVETGPNYALDVNNALTLVDSHDHSAGKGVPVTPAGLNINSDLSINNNNLTAIRTTRWQVQPSAPSLATDIGCAYVVGVDLYYNDVSGNQIRLTQGGSVAGSQGSISGLSSPASASYVSGSSTFVWQSNVSTPANLDAASVIIRNLTASSNGVTLSVASALASNYTLTLPLLPSQTNIMSLDTSGNIGASINVDNSSLQLTSNTLAIKAQGVTQGDLALRSTGTTVSAGGVAKSASCGSFSTTSNAFTAVTNLSVTITTTGRPIFIGLQPDASTSSATVGVSGTAATNIAVFVINIASAPVYRYTVFLGANSGNESLVPCSSIWALDFQAAGTYTYNLGALAFTAGGTALVSNAVLIAYEI